MTSRGGSADWISFDQVIGRRLTCILQVSTLDDENGIELTASYFVLDSGDSFYLPSGVTGRFQRYSADYAAEPLDGLANVYGRQITAILLGQVDPLHEDSVYLQLDGGMLITSVLSGPHGTASTGVYIHSPDDELGPLTLLAGELHRREAT